MCSASRVCALYHCIMLFTAVSLPVHHAYCQVDWKLQLRAQAPCDAHRLMVRVLACLLDYTQLKYYRYLLPDYLMFSGYEVPILLHGHSY